MDWDIFEKVETSEKGCFEIEDWGFSVHVVLGFKENSIYTYVSAKILQNGAKFIQKLTPDFKHHMWNLTTSGKQWKLQRAEIWWATFVQKVHSFS